MLRATAIGSPRTASLTLPRPILVQSPVVSTDYSVLESSCGPENGFKDVSKKLKLDLCQALKRNFYTNVLNLFKVTKLETIDTYPVLKV